MIPKIIHYTWFSGEPFPEKIQACIDSWHKYMPEYEFVLWDTVRIKEIDSVWLRESLAKKKWAYAADMVRLYAVHKYGGIYLDTDCIIYKSFDDLLDQECFIGKENSMHIEGGIQDSYLTSHCFGAVAGNSFIAKCLSYYDRHFIVSEDESLPMKLKWNVVLLPFVQSEIAEQLGYNPLPSVQTIQRLKDVTIYPKQYFDIIGMSSTAYCKHLALGGWRDKFAVEDKITFWYKIQWRIAACVEWFLNRCGYYMIKIR